MHQRGLNVAILGQTGVGKSTLVNYIFDETKRETGTGRPVTTKGFYKENKTINDVPITLIDSWGIEQGKDEEWLQLFNQFLHEHGIDHPVEEWLHVAIYCINAASSRIQDFDLQVINRLLEQKIEVVVVLTKAALSSAEEIDKLTAVIQTEAKKNVKVVPVNSKAETLFSGVPIETQGKEAIVQAIRNNYLEMLRLRLPDRIMRLLEAKIHAYGEAIHEKSKSKEAAEFAKTASGKFWSEDVEHIIKQEMEDALASYVQTVAISMSEVELFEAKFDVKKLIAGLTTGLGIGQIVRSFLIVINPILGTIATVVAAWSLKSLFSNRATEIAADFNNKMCEQLFKMEADLRRIVIDCINSTEEQVRLIEQGVNL